VSYTKDFLESKSQQYPEILKMTDEEALRYLDFMGELVESVDDSPTDIDYGYNLGGRVGFYEGGGGGLGIGAGSHSDQGGGTGPSNGGHHANDGPNQGFGPSYGPQGDPGSDNDGGNKDKDKDKEKKSFMDTVKGFMTPENAMKGLVSLGFGLPGTVAMGLVSAAEALGMDVGPAADTGPDQGGRADERRIAEAQNIVDTEIPLEMMFGGDPLKQQTYQRYIEAGYPEDQARNIADSLMTNFTA
jgi:hypothetical protein